MTTEKAAKTTKPKTTRASKTTTAPRIAATMPRENLFRTTTVRNDTANAFIRTTKTSSKAESPASVKMTTLKTNVVIRTQPPVPVTIAPVETNPTQPEQQTDKYLSLSDGEMQEQVLLFRAIRFSYRLLAFITSLETGMAVFVYKQGLRMR